ncbi:SRPBCC family protein [Catenulispora sp. NF23]|uniref:SRPBCC family protein n=1 Tax=Catenulispora pinistramenti TaxID=2705254 RepID=A0ABS5KNJ2_9ACTN|nr:SRPBCC family protein [Catenulispora pinistramenti]MBS2532651.1 SRPBCC family protein [Catenulispora pinistramenti]MBS2547592.1 SRPBCC family protein [Catenulispora pinistramenti]
MTHSIDVDVPVATAYDRWSRFESFPHFMSGVRQVETLGGGHSRWLTELGGVHREFEARITEQRAGKSLAWESVGGDLFHSGTVTFDELTKSCTRITVTIDWQPDGLVEKAAGALGLDNVQVLVDLERFKEWVEGSEGSEGSDQALPEPRAVQV